MEPLSLYGNNVKKMMYLKFGHLGPVERENRRKVMYTKIDNFFDGLIFRMKRYEVLLFKYDRNLWPFYPDYKDVVHKFIYHVGIVDIDLISYDDLIAISKMDVPYYIDLSLISK